MVDIVSAKNNISSILFKFVRNYFEEAEKTSGFIHPIYLQHDGHSRLIVGIEIGQHESLLLFDPGTRKYQVDQFKKNKSKFISIFRRGMASFKKKEVFQTHCEFWFLCVRFKVCRNFGALL